MTYSYAFSDLTIKKIIDEIFNKNSEVLHDEFMEAKKPDVVVLYNKEISNDVIVVEFKGLNTTLGEKENAIAELNRNCLVLKRKMKDINTIWGYIITTIDDEFAFSLEASGYRRLFSNSEEGCAFHLYNDSSNAHIYTLDMNSITSDAFARNKTFLDILKSK